jgi:hypothetical protein
MPMSQRHIGFCLLIVLGMHLVSLATPGRAAEECHCLRRSGSREAKVAFGVKNGWVEFTLTCAGQPVNAASVQVFDAFGSRFASGETGPDGMGVFPLPKGPSLAVAIEFDKRTAEPVLVTNSDGVLTPPEVLLSFGAKPCCRNLRTVNQEQSTGWLRLLGSWLLGGGVLCLFLAWCGSGGGGRTGDPRGHHGNRLVAGRGR